MSNFHTSLQPRWRIGILLPALCLTLVACGGESATKKSALTPEQTAVLDEVKARQANFQDLGAAFKAISDEIKAGRPNSTTASFSIKSVARYGPQVKLWFPEGTGPETGFDMEAKANIWSDPEAFAEAISEFETASASLGQAGTSGEADAILTNFQKVGKTCKACHDQFRQEN